MGCPTEDHWYIPYGTPGTMGQSQSVTSHLVGCPYRSKALSFNSYEKFIKLRVRKAGVTEVTSKDSKPTPEAKKPQHASKKSALVEVHVNIVQPIKGSLQPSLHADSAPSFTWHFDSSEVEALVDVLWDQVKKDIDAIPCRSPTKTFPCRGNDGESAILDLQIEYN